MKRPEWIALLGAFSLGVGSLGSSTGDLSSSPGTPPASSVTADPAPPDKTCPEAMLSDDGVCVHLPSSEEDLPESAPLPNLHRERSGRWASYEQIPRRPERAASYDAYRYPIPPGMPGGHYVLSGYDLDRPDEAQRRGRRLRAVGHGGLDLPQRRGTPVRLVRLEHEQGETEVTYVGHLFGNTVITKHTVREAGRLRDYVVLYGHLDRSADGLKARAPVHEGDTLGYVGDSDSPSLVHLHLEIRRVREGVAVAEVSLDRFFDVTIVCDPRNVLPLALSAPN